MSRNRFSIRRFQKVASLALAVGFVLGTVECPAGPNLLSERLSFAGILQGQVDLIERSQSNEAIGPEEWKDSIYMRRLLLGGKLRMSDRSSFESMADFSGDKAALHYLRLRLGDSDHARFSFGYQKAPFVKEETTSSRLVKPMERSVNTRFWSEVVGLGSYHSGVYLSSNLSHGLSSQFAVTHNEKSDFSMPDFLEGALGYYLRIEKSGVSDQFGTFSAGLDIAHLEGRLEPDVSGVSLYSQISKSGWGGLVEVTAGELSPGGKQLSRPVGWNLQLSRKLGTKLELIASAGEIDTDGWGAKLSTLVRVKTRSSDLSHRVTSQYLGVSYLMESLGMRYSVGYEKARGDVIVGPGASPVAEVVSGMRMRLQYAF